MIWKYISKHVLEDCYKNPKFTELFKRNYQDLLEYGWQSLHLSIFSFNLYNSWIKQFENIFFLLTSLPFVSTQYLFSI